MRLLVGVGATLLASGCGLFDLSGNPVDVPEPDFGGVALPDLEGEIVVTDADGNSVASSALQVEGGAAHGVVPSLAPGTDYKVTLQWRSAGVVVARSAPKSFRVDAGHATQLRVDLVDYEYPDDDGDGAINMYEVAFGAESPEAAAAPRDADLAPTGFFNDAVALVPVENYVGAVAVSDTLGVAFVTSERPNAAGGADGHQIHQISLTTYARRSQAFDCDSGFVSGIEVRPTDLGVQGAWGCEEHLQPFHLLPSLLLDDPLPTAAGLPGVAYSAAGDLLFSIGPRQVLAYDGQDPLPPGTAVPLLIGFRPCDLADTGDKLLITDCAADVIEVVPHDGLLFDGENGSFTDPDLVAIDNPTSIVVHPAGHRAYVGCSGDGTLHVVDITSDYPVLDWKDLVVVPVGQGLVEVAIDPRGYWVYASSAERLLRLNTLTNEVEWELLPGAGVTGAFSDLALSPDGSLAAVAAKRGMLQLGFSSRPHWEQEPNQDLASASPLLDEGIGWVAADELGGITADPLFPGDDAEDAYEDLWRLDPGLLSDTVAIAIVPAVAQSVIFKAGLLDADAVALDTVGHNVGATGVPPPGSGMLLLAAATTEPRYVALSAHDLGGDSAYEIVARTVGAPAPVAEQEPDDDWQAPQALSGYPLVVAGSVATADTGTLGLGPQVFADCFAVATQITHLALRLDFGAGDDLELAVVDAAGTQLNAQVAGAGNPESFIFPARTVEPGFTVCVGIPAANPNPSAAYTLTVVNLAGG